MTEKMDRWIKEWTKSFYLNDRLLKWMTNNGLIMNRLVKWTDKQDNGHINKQMEKWNNKWTDTYSSIWSQCPVFTLFFHFCNTPWSLPNFSTLRWSIPLWWLLSCHGGCYIKRAQVDCSNDTKSVLKSLIKWNYDKQFLNTLF